MATAPAMAILRSSCSPAATCSGLGATSDVSFRLLLGLWHHLLSCGRESSTLHRPRRPQRAHVPAPRTHVWQRDPHERGPAA